MILVNMQNFKLLSLNEWMNEMNEMREINEMNEWN